MADDNYAAWYQAKLWQLLPAIYRTQDAVTANVPGPLQELFNRLGIQTATLRRSIDRMWENQSIETCDDWVVPYIGDLLATRLVSCLDARAQRLDVARTIYYRRRAGTLGLLEELVADIAGRDARAVEFFRRLGRTRHQFDPPLGNLFAADVPSWRANTTYATGAMVTNLENAYLCTAGGISGTSGGPTGTGTTVGDGTVSWSFFEPAGSLVPAVIEGLAGAVSRTPAGGFADLRNPYAASNVSNAFDEFAHTADLRKGSQSSGWYNISHLGVFIWWLQSFPILGATAVSNGKSKPCYTFDPSGRTLQLFAPSSRTAASFGDDWVSPNEWQLPVPVREVLWAQYPDPLYPAAFSVSQAAGPSPPPLDRSLLNIHPERGVFSFVGTRPRGKFLSNYHCALMSMIGAGGFPPALLESSAYPTTEVSVSGGAGLDAALSAPASNRTIRIGDSQTYPGPTANLNLGSSTLALIAADQARPMVRWSSGTATWKITGKDANLVIEGLWIQGADIVLSGTFESVRLRFVTLDPGTAGTGGALIGEAIDGLPLAPVHLWIEASIETLSLERCITGPIRTRKQGAVEQLNATDSILQAIVTPAGDDYALENEIGNISLARCTVLGPCAVHRLDASECILDEIAIADDTQHGCVRFSSIAQGSALHAPYRSVSVPAQGPYLVTRRFGSPDYARLRRLADNAIIAPQVGDTILGGAQNGAEMGAFQSEGITLKKRGLVLKFEEYAPLGVFPVWIDAD